MEGERPLDTGPHFVEEPAADDVRAWRSTTDTSLTPLTRRRLERIRDRQRGLRES